MTIGEGIAPPLSVMLDAAENASPVEALEAVTREIAAALGATSVSFLIADLSGRALVRLAHVAAGTPAASDVDRRDVEESAVEMPFDGGPAEQALRSQTVTVVPPTDERDDSAADVWTVLAPVTERGEVIGLLETQLPQEPTDAVVAELGRTAHVLAFVVIANRRHTDLFEWGQRSTPYTLSAEIQRRLLPAAFTCEAGAFTLSAWLEPASEVGGDSFDYSVSREVLHLSVTDAMGHGVASALTATLCVGSLRNSRRQGVSLLEQVDCANTALLKHATATSDEGFVTGLLGRLDLRDGTLSLVNAGHVRPYLARDGVVTPIDLPAGPPMGLFPDVAYRCTDMVLRPGDRLVIVTDGMLERNAAALDLVAEISQTRALHARETTRRLADDVLAITGPSLADDATLLVLDWHGTAREGMDDRQTSAGADATPG